jgi:O-glycosyl hydrolase
MSKHQSHKKQKSLMKSRILQASVATVCAAATHHVSTHNALAATATISPTAQQTFKGWGTMPGHADTQRTDGEQYKVLHGRTPKLYDATYSLNFQVGRYEIIGRISPFEGQIGGTTESNRALQDMAAEIKLGRDRGIKNYILSIWFPPAYMVEDHDGDGDYILKASYADNSGYDYATFLADAIKYLRDTAGVGLPLAISVQNEPDYEHMNRMTENPARWREVVKQLRATLDSPFYNMPGVVIHGSEGGDLANYPVMLGLPSANNGGYQALIDDPAFNAAMGAYAHHTYALQKPGVVGANLRAIPKEVWSTENSTPSYADSWAADQRERLYFRMMGSDFITLPSNYWIWYHGFQQAGPGEDLYSVVHGNWQEPYGPFFTKQYWSLKKIFSTVQPGWKVKRVAVSGDTDISGEPETGDWGGSVRTFAFESPNADASVVVLVNDSANNKFFDVAGLRGNWANVFLCNASSNSMAKQSLPVTNGTAIGVNLPAYSVIMVETTSQGVTREVWNNVSGTGLSSVDWASTPTSANRLTTLESLSDIADNYGERLRGYITAPATGTYYFWVSGDDDFQFNISTDDTSANLGAVEANSIGATLRQQWDSANARLFTFSMTAGNRYYFEAFHKESSGGDHFAVAWTRPDHYKQIATSTELPTWPREIVPATVLTPYTETVPVPNQPGPNLVSNAGFEAEQYSTQTPSGWSEWSNLGGVSAGYTETANGAKSGAYHGTHRMKSAFNIYTFQSKTGLANGLYTLRVWAKKSGHQTSCYLEAKDFGGIARRANVPNGTTTGAYQLVEMKDISVTNGQCTIGLWTESPASKNQSWVYFDDFEFFKQ